MHELSVAQSVVEACSARAGDAAVLRVTLQIGTLSCVLPESLHFCFEVAAQGTPLESAQLEIIAIPAVSRCRDCARDVEMDDALATCACGSVNLEPPRGGNELRIKSMQIEEAA